MPLRRAGQQAHEGRGADCLSHDEGIRQGLGRGVDPDDAGARRLIHSVIPAVTLPRL